LLAVVVAGLITVAAVALENTELELECLLQPERLIPSQLALVVMVAFRQTVAVDIATTVGTD
jgi:hypothetical protein